MRKRKSRVFQQGVPAKVDRQVFTGIIRDPKLEVQNENNGKGSQVRLPNEIGQRDWLVRSGRATVTMIYGRIENCKENFKGTGLQRDRQLHRSRELLEGENCRGLQSCRKTESFRKNHRKENQRKRSTNQQWKSNCRGR